MFNVAVLQLFFAFPRQAAPKLPVHSNSLTYMSPSCGEPQDTKAPCVHRKGLEIGAAAPLLSLGLSYSTCKSNSYLAHRIVILGSESKQEMTWHSEIGALQDLYKHNTINPCKREKSLVSCMESSTGYTQKSLAC